MSDSFQQSFLDSIVAIGKAIPCAGNQPLEMSEPGKIWFVETGAVDIFLVERKNGVEQSAQQNLMRAEAGRLLPSIEPQSEFNATLSLIAKGLPGTVLREVSIDKLTTFDPKLLAAMVDTWIKGLSCVLSYAVPYPEPSDVLVEVEQTSTAEGRTFSARSEVVWVQVPTVSSGENLFMGLVEISTEDTTENASANLLPLTSETWLKLPQSQQLSSVLSSHTLAEQGRLISALVLFHELVLATERINRMLAVLDQVNLEKARAKVRDIEEGSARRQLFDLSGVSDSEGVEIEEPVLVKALRAIGRFEGIEFTWRTHKGSLDASLRLEDILDVSGVNGRKVRLDTIERWWVGDSGAILAFRDDGSPVVLLPHAAGNYRLFDPENGRTTSVNSDTINTLSGEAWVFYRALDPEPVQPNELLKKFSKGHSATVSRFVLLGLLGGLIMLLPAVAIGFIVNQVIPSGELSILYATTTGLAVVAVIWALVRILQGMALMRFEGRVASRIEAAIWDRLLKLPPEFLHQFPSADRAIRGMAFQRLRDIIQKVAVNSVMSFIFLLPALLIIFFVDIALGAIASVFGLLCLATIVLLGRRQISPYKRIIRASHHIAGVLFQFMNGISKLRVDGAEGFAYAVWAKHYGEQQSSELELGRWNAVLRAFGSALPLFATAVLLACATVFGLDNLETGDFLFISVVFLLFIAGIVRFGTLLDLLIAIPPELEQIEPFLETVPQERYGDEPVEDLGGDVVFDRVSFRYDPEGPLILDNVSLRARRGEFVAIAGESGAGKSTLFQLALGLISPASGTVYYDGRDLKQLNVKQVRRKIGTVPQRASLHPENLWDNIAADQEDIDVESVWRAAKIADIDHVIADMPMQLLTCVGDSQTVMSGGEIQRVMIARALARNPRILLLDEATNFLDNESQFNVMRNLTQLQMTRIIIAHRLSTLRQADRIYVMQSGKIVEQGTFSELTERNGVFSELVRRQEA